MCDIIRAERRKQVEKGRDEDDTGMEGSTGINKSFFLGWVLSKGGCKATRYEKEKKG